MTLDPREDCEEFVSAVRTTKAPASVIPPLCHQGNLTVYLSWQTARLTRPPQGCHGSKLVVTE